MLFELATRTTTSWKVSACSWEISSCEKRRAQTKPFLSGNTAVRIMFLYKFEVSLSPPPTRHDCRAEHAHLHLSLIHISIVARWRRGKTFGPLSFYIRCLNYSLRNKHPSSYQPPHCCLAVLPVEVHRSKTQISICLVSLPSFPSWKDPYSCLLYTSRCV